MTYKNRALAGSLKLGVAALSFAAVLGWSGHANVVSFGSEALAALSPAQMSSVQADVQTALANISPSLTGAARDIAIQQALATVVRNEITAFGSDAITAVANAAISQGVSAVNVVQGILPAAIAANVPAATVIADIEFGGVSAGASATVLAEAIIAVSETANIANAAVGTGLGQAAAQLALANNPTAANQIAAVVANEGLPGTGPAFASAVRANGGSEELASLGTARPGGTGATAGGGAGIGDVGGVGGGGGGPSSFSGQSFTDGTPSQS